MVKVGVIGIGNMGKHHARVYSQLDGVELVAVSDLNENPGREISQKLNCKFYNDYREMLDKEDIQALSIAVPTTLHREIALECIKRGKHILVEKPISNTIETAREIIDSARGAGVKLGVGHTERFNPAVQKLKNIIDSGDLGEITTIIARRVGVFPPQVKDASVVVDIAVHDIDIFNYFLKKQPEAIHAASGKALTNHREDYADILLKYDGTNAFIQVNWITPVKIRNLAVTGTKGYAELNYITQDLTIFRSNYRNIETFSDVVEFGTPEMISVTVNKEEPLKRELKDFTDSIKENREPLVTGEDALKALEIAMKIMEASK